MKTVGRVFFDEGVNKIIIDTEPYVIMKVRALFSKSQNGCKGRYTHKTRSRLDFLLTRGEEKIAVECKINAFKRAEVYRQIRRYTEEINLTSVVLVAPWNGIPSFIIDKTPVSIIDTSINAI